MEIKIDTKEEKMMEPQRIEDIYGTFPTVSVAPTFVPRKLYEQIVVYKSGATLRLYVYDVDNRAWRYTTLT